MLLLLLLECITLEESVSYIHLNYTLFSLVISEQTRNTLAIIGKPAGDTYKMMQYL